MLAMWMFFWDDADWIPPTPSDTTFWCAMTGMSSKTGGGCVPELG